jgi:hypothetical protein
MSVRRALRLTHLASTVWFMVCVGYVLVLALHEYGFQWWLIFSLSGPSALLILLLISLYLFALFRGVGEAQQIEVEHPLTTTSYYMGFYVAAPLLGGLAGNLGMLAGDVRMLVTDPVKFLLGVALGTLGTTFTVWVVVDPITGLIEMLLPTSRRCRAERLARTEAQRRARQEKRERLLTEALARDEREQQQWQQKLRPQAERLAALLTCDTASFARAEQEAVDIGAEAWRLGGLSCMRQLRDMALALCAERQSERTVDYISYWWDGIGDWRKPPSP